MIKKNTVLFEEFIKGISATAFGTSCEAEKPFPMTDSLPLWYDLFVIKAHQAFKKIDIQSYKNDREALVELLPTVSNLRFILYKMMRSYAGLTKDKKAVAQESYQSLFNFLLEAIPLLVPRDSFCHKSNLFYSDQEVNEKVAQLSLKSVDSIEESRLLAKLNLGLTSLVHGVYNDIVTDFGVDVFGPYQVFQDGKNCSLIIKHFPYLNPPDLNWPPDFLPQTKEVYLYLCYEGMEWEIKGVGCHTNILSGNPIADLRKYAVLADGLVLQKEEIEVFTKELLKKSQDLYLSIIDSGFEEQKRQAIFQECFQFKKICDKAGSDWKPDQELLSRMEGKEINPTPGVISSMKQYRDSLKLDLFIEEVLL